jgi:hypothetical protein
MYNLLKNIDIEPLQSHDAVAADGGLAEFRVDAA